MFRGQEQGEQGGMPWWFPYYHEEQNNLYRSVNLQKEQLTNPDHQAQTTGSFPQSTLGKWSACPFPEAEEPANHSLLENEGSPGVPEALVPYGAVLCCIKDPA